MNPTNYKELLGARFKVVEATRLGRACVATRPLLSSEIICHLRGTPISHKQFWEKYGDTDNVLQVGPEQFVDLTEPYVCFNHSCEPNAGVRNHGVLFALRDIAPGEEITYDYSTTAVDPMWSMPCRCQTDRCRETIGDFLSLPHSLREDYRQAGTLMQHVLDIYY